MLSRIGALAPVVAQYTREMIKTGGPAAKPRLSSPATPSGPPMGKGSGLSFP